MLFLIHKLCLYWADWFLTWETIQLSSRLNFRWDPQCAIHLAAVFRWIFVFMPIGIQVSLGFWIKGKWCKTNQGVCNIKQILIHGGPTFFVVLSVQLLEVIQRVIDVLLIDRERAHYSKSKTKALMYWPSDSEVWDFPVMTEWTRLISYLLYGLFFMDLSPRPIKTNNWSADNFKKHVTSMSYRYIWACDTVRWHWSADTLFDRCQLTITWMSTIRLNTECTYLGHLASNA